MPTEGRPATIHVRSKAVVQAQRNRMGARLDECWANQHAVVFEIMIREMRVGVIKADNPFVIERVICANTDRPAGISPVKLRISKTENAICRCRKATPPLT